MKFECGCDRCPSLDSIHDRWWNPFDTTAIKHCIYCRLLMANMVLYLSFFLTIVIYHMVTT